MDGEIHRKDLNIAGDLNFEEFLKRYIGIRALRKQTYWIESFDGTISLDFIGRFENLSEDFMKICELMNIEPINLPHELKGSGINYREKYSKTSKEIISKYYQKEIELFDYDFEE